ncbi:ATP-dependent acyl-CoA ligase [Streptomyces mashuensis]|uniref:ATP-dependent acyl-CoA ligase n=1 Tax=Streptomyces mashuensis TaxID=33904 RepID=A0A919B4G9_9ACTN|nr:AMP-binding protein [Streptomyces mashuensis]GHF52389.1 ATP-dependent acyl-CoA ligase [Streptomyces mashuensis]
MNFEELADRYRRHDSARVVHIDAAGRRRELTQAELHALATERAGQLAVAGVRPGHVVGIRAANSVDWLAWDLAAVATGAVLKAFPDEMPVDEPGAFLARHGLALLITDAEGLPAHPAVVAPDGTPGRDVAVVDAPRGEPGDLHSLVFSSGTSGRLKGLNVSRKGTEYVIGRFVEAFAITSADRHLIFLPLANYQQRLSVYCCLWTGADLVLAPYQRVFAAVKTERPTFLIGPPVFYDTVLQLHRKGGTGTLAAMLGGDIRFLITGMAPIRRETLDAFWAEEVPLLEAYGMTESGMIAWNTLDEHRLGSVGRLIDPDAVTLLPDGELLVHRPAPLSSGYFDTGGAQDDTYRPDGTIVTGDYGELDADGYLTLLGRKKDVIALGSGRKVHPAEIESFFTGIAEIAEMVVVPTPQSSRLGAIVTPAPPATPGDEAAEAVIRKRIEEVNQALEPHQRVMSLVFSAQPLRSDPRFMTANMKLSRPLAAAHFAQAVGSTEGAGA